MPHHRRGRAKNQRRGSLFFMEHKANGVKKRGAVGRVFLGHDLCGSWRQEFAGHLAQTEGLREWSAMAPWEREHGEGAPEPCGDPWCDCDWWGYRLAQIAEPRTEPLTATLAEMAA